MLRTIVTRMSQSFVVRHAPERCAFVIDLEGGGALPLLFSFLMSVLKLVLMLRMSDLQRRRCSNTLIQRRVGRSSETLSTPLCQDPSVERVSLRSSPGFISLPLSPAWYSQLSPLTNHIATTQQEAFEDARRNGILVIPSCSYVSSTFLQRNPEFQAVVAPRL